MEADENAVISFRNGFLMSSALKIKLLKRTKLRYILLNNLFNQRAVLNNEQQSLFLASSLIPPMV